MPTYEIKLSNGKTYHVEADKPPSEQEMYQQLGIQGPKPNPAKKDPLEGTLGGDLIKNVSASAEHAAGGVQDVIDGTTKFDPNNPFQAVSGAEKALAGGFGMLTSPITAAIDQVPGATPVMQGVMGGIQNVLTYGVGKPLEYATSGWYSPEQKGLDPNAVGEGLTMAFAPKIISKGIDVAANTPRVVANAVNAATRGLQTGKGARLLEGKRLLEDTKAGMQDQNPKGPRVNNQDAINSVPDQVTLDNGGVPVQFPTTLGQATNNDRLLRDEKTRAQTDPAFSSGMRNMLNDQTDLLHRTMNENVPRGTDPNALVQHAQGVVQSAESGVNRADIASAPQTRSLEVQGQTAKAGLDAAQEASKAKVSDAFKAIDPEGKVTIAVDSINNSLATKLNEITAKDPAYQSTASKILDSLWNWDHQQHGQAYTVQQLNSLRSNALAMARLADSAMPGTTSAARKFAAGQFAEAIDGLIKAKADAKGAPEVYQQWRDATDMSKAEAEKWQQPDSVRTAQGSNSAGGDLVPDITTLDKFVRPGLTGKVEVGRLLKAVENQPNVVQAVSDRLLSLVDRTSAAKIEAFMDGKSGYGAVLDMPEFAAAKAGLQDLHAKQVIFEGAKKGIFGELAKNTPNPEAAIRQILDAPNSATLIKALKDELAPSPLSGKSGNAGAWNSVRALLAEELSQRITSDTTFTKNENPTFKMAATQRATERLIKDIGAIDPPLADALKAVSEGVSIMQRTKEGGYGNGSQTAANVADATLRAGTKGIIGHAGAGAVVGATLGSIIPVVGQWLGAGLGAAAEAGLKARSNLVRQKLAREAALDPAFAKALMTNAAEPRNWALFPDRVKTNLEKNFGFTAAVRAEAAKKAKEKQ